MSDGLVKGANTWLYDFTLKGKRHCGDTGKTHNQKVLARAFVEDLRSKLRAEHSNLVLGIKPDPKTTCGELLAEWLENHTGDHATRVERDWRLHLLATFKDVKAMDVTPPMIEMVRNAYLKAPSLRNAHYTDKLLAKAEKAKKEGREVILPEPKERTNRSANKLVAHFNLVFSWAVETERLPRMPFKSLAALLEQDPVRTFLKQDQVDPFLQLVDLGSNLHQMIAVRAMLYMALREDEALHFRWDGLNSDYSSYTTFDTKTGKNIPLPVPEDLQELLRQARAQVPGSCEWCIPQMPAEGLTRRGTPRQAKKGTPWTPHGPQFATKVIDRVSAAMGISGLSPHRMRGTCVTLMARMGANAFVIKKMGRWKRMDTALKYVDIVEDDLRAAQQGVFGKS
jgi:integrase